ncbi:hypothetical protein PMI11_03359 [Rhizobium sp. CF142]|nr:hypothetical protein PMI11_03359 [Rhizobium sp. CF142]
MCWIMAVGDRLRGALILWCAVWHPPLSCRTSPPQGGRLAGGAGFPKQSALQTARRQRCAKARPLADLPTCGGDVRQDRGGCPTARSQSHSQLSPRAQGCHPPFPLKPKNGAGQRARLQPVWQLTGAEVMTCRAQSPVLQATWPAADARAFPEPFKRGKGPGNHDKCTPHHRYADGHAGAA